MRDLLPTWLRASAATLLAVINTIVHVPVLLLVAVLKMVLPLAGPRRVFNRALTSIAESWIGLNSALITSFTHTRFVVVSDVALRADGHYLVLANHQSWVDIPVLQLIFNRKIPLLRFFLKQQLIWVPLLGLAWWALDFPFMKRYSRETLLKRPELAGRDVEATRRACEKFRDMPVSVMNFVEGTRFTTGKHAQQGSTFRQLLKPRAGGVAFVLGAMGPALHAILDVTIAYPHGRPTIGDLFMDRVPEVRLHIQQLSIPAEFVGRDYQSDATFRQHFQAWMNQLWELKDERLDELTAAGSQHVISR